jgi:hypothetical protein
MISRLLNRDMKNGTTRKARHRRYAALQGRIAHQRLHERGQQGVGRQQYAEDEEADDRGADEVAVESERARKERVLRRGGLNDEHIDADHRHDRFGPDLGGMEPVLGGAAIEHQLKRGGAERQGAKAQEVERPLPPAPVLRHEYIHAQEGDDAQRHIDVEDPAPGEVLGQPAADRRPHHRPQHQGRAPQAHHPRHQPGWKDVEHHRLRQRHQRGGGHPLQQAEEHDLRKAGGDPAQHRGHGEGADRQQEHLLAADLLRHPARQRQRDRRGDDVGGQHPGDLVRRRRQAALHVRQGDVGDGGVERIHQRGEHQRRGDRDPIGNVLRRRHPRTYSSMAGPAFQ